MVSVWGALARRGLSGARFSAVYRMSRSRKWDGESRNLKSVAPQRPAPTLCKTASPLPQRIADCGPLANCGNPAFLYPFVISYAVKTKVDTDYQANDMPVCVVRLPSPTYPTH